MKVTRVLKRQDLYWLAVLLVAALLIWCGAYNRWNAETWRTPTTYGGDAWWGMAVAKAAATGEAVPLLAKNPPSLGAPFVATWNDYPSVEEGLIAWSGLLAWSFGILVGSNVAVIAAHLLAAITFYLVCRRLRYDAALSAGGALLFAFTPYAFWRGLPHLGLAYYWHLPLGMLVIWWCLAKAPLTGAGRKLRLSLIVAVLFGMQNAYYTGMLLQFLFLASLAQLVRRAPWSKVLAPLLVGSLALFTFLVMNADTLLAGRSAGMSGSVKRSYQYLEIYALKPIELLLPQQHRIDGLAKWTDSHYYTKAAILGEAGAAYLGATAIVAFGCLLYVAFARFAQRRGPGVPSHLLFILWVFAYSVIGGINGLVGFVFELFRGTNRYSVVILLLLLLFAVRQLTYVARRWSAGARVGVAIAITAVGLLDQVPPAPSRASIAAVGVQVNADVKLVRTLERKLPDSAAIFQMPVAEFPETPPIHMMSAYEHFRPYLYSSSLRFSFGSNKGNPRDAWQREAEQLGGASLVALLERYGFSAVLISRKGYADGGTALLQSLAAAGRDAVLSQSAEFICIQLRPSPNPILPPEYTTAWYPLEGTAEQNRRWSAGSAAIVLTNPRSSSRPARMTFALETLLPRRLTIFVEGQRVFERQLDANSRSAPVVIETILRPGRNVVSFETDRPGELPGNGDPRPLAFSIQDLRIEY